MNSRKRPKVSEEKPVDSNIKSANAKPNQTAPAKGEPDGKVRVPGQNAFETQICRIKCACLTMSSKSYEHHSQIPTPRIDPTHCT